VGISLNLIAACGQACRQAEQARQYNVSVMTGGEATETGGLASVGWEVSDEPTLTGGWASAGVGALAG